MNERRCRRTIGSCRNARTVADERVASAECRKEDDDGATHVAIPQPILDAKSALSIIVTARQKTNGKEFRR